MKPMMRICLLLAAWLIALPVPRAPCAPPSPDASHRSRPGVQKAEAALRAQEERLKEQSERLEGVVAQALALARRRQALEAETAGMAGRLKDMLPRLWAMDMRLKGVVEASVAPWDEADRNRAWLGAVCDDARVRYESLLRKKDELAQIRSRESELASEERALTVLVEKTRVDVEARRNALPRTR